MLFLMQSNCVICEVRTIYLYNFTLLFLQKVEYYINRKFQVTYFASSFMYLLNNIMFSFKVPCNDYSKQPLFFYTKLKKIFFLITAKKFSL